MSYDNLYDVSISFFFFQAEDGIRDSSVTGVQTCAFFFQAEDGIRDSSVTGVQTCALPIYSVFSPFSHSHDVHTEWAIGGAAITMARWYGIWRSDCHATAALGSILPAGATE